jgi:hypothetical protein
LSIRPESVRLLAPTGEAPAENLLAATVLARTFQGETEHVRVRLIGGEVTVSDRPTSLPAVPPGGPARIHLPPESIRAYARPAT